MAAYVSRKKVEDGVDWDVVLLLSRTIKARILIDLNFYREIKDLEHFSRTWTYGGVLCFSCPLFFSLSLFIYSISQILIISLMHQTTESLLLVLL